MADSEAPDASYTVFIRLPFPRGDFVDPPAVDWDATKDATLWKILSKASKNNEIDWNALADKFDVTLPFVLQQAAWLYERQLSQVKAHMRRVGASKSSAQSPMLGTESAGAEAMRRTGSGGGGPRAPSSLTARKDSPIPRNNGSISNTPVAPLLSRTSSVNTIQNRPLPQTSPRPAKANLHRLSISPQTNIRSTPPLPGHGPTALAKSKNVSSSEAAESSSPDSSSDSEPAQSRLLRRPPRFQSHKQGGTIGGDDEDEDAPAFLPFSTTSGPQGTQADPSATLRGDPQQINHRPTPKKSTEVIQQSQTSDSSASSTAPTNKTAQKSPSHLQRPPGPLSPRRTAELAGRSPVGRGKTIGREGSDGTPSMGSSFSDLDDASVTQSALEEALASNMQKGGMASRMSTISQALKSRYL